MQESPNATQGGHMANSTRFTFTLIGSSEPFRVVEFEGDERISSPFEWQITVASEDANLELNDFVNKSAVLTLLGDEPTPTKRLIHGFISEASYLSTGNRFSLYRITLTPQLSYFNYRSGHRIFQNMSVQDIIKQLFSDAKIPNDQIQWKLKQSYPAKEYCVQYDETEFDFISRLLAEEGIHYHFTHHLDRHVIVFSDSNTAFTVSENNPTLPYIQEQSRAYGETSAYQFELTRKVTANNASLIDFTFTSPKNALIANAGNGKNQVTTYPAKIANGQGKQYAATRLSQLQHLQEHATAHTNSLLMSGTRFALSGAKNKSWNQDYVVFNIHHEGKQPQSLEEYASAQPCTYANKLTCIPSSVTHRPEKEQLTKPDAQGTTPAIVTGPAGEEIYTDQYGRVKVQFPWDREGSGNEASSCWLRVKQGWAGIEYGSNNIPRIGQEVIVSYENADPDRPLVTGRVYNGKNKTPYALPAHKTRTALKTQSSLKGDGYNEFRIEDKKGQEQLFIHGEKDMDIHIKQDKKSLIQNNHHITVDGSHYQQQNQLHQTIGGANNEKAGKQLSLTVSKDITIKISGAKAVQAGNALYIKSSMKAVLDAGQQLILKAGAGTVVLDPSGVSITGPIVTINEGGGGGSASAASPVSPAAPVEADKNKAGQNFKSSSTGIPPLPPSDADKKQAAAQAINFRMASRTRAPVVSIPAPPSKKSAQPATKLKPTTNTSKPSASEITPPAFLPLNPITNTDIKDWLQLQLLWDDKHKTPVKLQPYTLYLADGSTRKGTLDAKGQAFEENLPKGTVKIEYTTEATEAAKLKQLKAQFSTTLKNIIVATQHDTDMQQQVANNMSPDEMGLVILGAAFMGTWDFVSDMASFVVMVGKALYTAEMAYLDLLEDILTGDIREIQRKYEAAGAAGATSYEAAGDVAEAINLLMRDEETWDLLTDFPGEYWDALSAVDATRQLAPLVIDIVITIFSFGVGAPLLAANISTKTGKLIAKAGELLADIVKALKKTGQAVKKNATSNSVVAEKIRKEIGRSKKPKTQQKNTSPSTQRQRELDASIQKKRVIPASLEEARNILKQRRKELVENGYTPKYTDEELLHLASKGEVNDRHIVRIEWEKPPEQGLGFTRDSGRAPIWTTTFDQIEKADTDPDLITNILGFPEKFDPNSKYKMYLIDQGEDFATNSDLSIIPSYEKLGDFSKKEMTSDKGFDTSLIDEVMTPEYSKQYAKHMNEFSEQVSSPYKLFDSKEIKEFTSQMSPKEKANFKTRHLVNTELGANPLYAGNGLTKPFDSAITQSEYGVLEVFTFQRTPPPTGELIKSDLLTVMPLSPLPKI